MGGAGQSEGDDIGSRSSGFRRGVVYQAPYGLLIVGGQAAIVHDQPDFFGRQAIQLFVVVHNSPIAGSPRFSPVYGS